MKRDQIYDAPKLSYLKINKSTDEAEITSDFPPRALPIPRAKIKGKHIRIKRNVLTWTCIVVLSKALYNIGSTSVRISSRGVFSNIMCKFSRSVTVAWTVFGAENTLLKQIYFYNLRKRRWSTRSLWGLILKSRVALHSVVRFRSSKATHWKRN